MNEIAVGGNYFHTNTILEYIQNITPIVKDLVVNTVIGIVSKNK